MRIPPTHVLPALLALFLLAGCDGDGLADKTYPPADDFPEITVASLLTAPPGRYNVTAYVSDANECPEGVSCFAPDSIVLVQRPLDDSDQMSVWLFADAVRQFQVGERYVFSVEVRDGEGPPHTLTLLGYSRAGRGA